MSSSSIAIADRIKLKLEEINNYSNNEEIISSNKEESEKNNSLLSNDISSIDAEIQENYPTPYDNMDQQNFEESKSKSPENIQENEPVIEECMKKNYYSLEKTYKEDIDLMKITPVKTQNKYLKSLSTDATIKNNFNYIDLGNSVDEKEENEDTYGIEKNTCKEKKFSYKKYGTSKEKYPAMRKSNLKYNLKFTSCRNIGGKYDFFQEKENLQKNEEENEIKKPSTNSRNSIHVKFHNISHHNDEEENNNSTAKNICNFLWKSFVLFLLFILLALDPLIVILLKFIDFIRGKFSKKNEDENSTDSYSDLPSDLDNQLQDDLENGKNLSFYERYYNLFFDNSIFKNYRKGIKTVFIGVSLLLNILILTSNMEKIIFTNLFFLNNLYLLFHTMDLYNEKLIRYTEKIKWNTLLEIENK